MSQYNVRYYELAFSDRNFWTYGPKLKSLTALNHAYRNLGAPRGRNWGNKSAKPGSGDPETGFYRWMRK